MQPFSFHCHTIFSDGNNTVEEMIAAAQTAGFTHLGISDHLIAPNSADLDALLPKCQAHVAHIHQCAQKMGFKAYAGFEADYFPSADWEDAFRRFKRLVGADYFIGSNHFLTNEIGQTFSAFDIDWTLVSTEQQKYLFQNHFYKTVRLVRSGLFDFLAHPDFIRWGSPCGETDFKAERLAIIDALAETGLPVELNTKGFRKIGDFYPARWMLVEIVRQNIPVLISDDAHRASEIGAEFALAEDYLADLGVTNRIDLAERL